jgi:S1-C subfamily serine protease
LFDALYHCWFHPVGGNAVRKGHAGRVRRRFIRQAPWYFWRRVAEDASQMKKPALYSSARRARSEARMPSGPPAAPAPVEPAATRPPASPPPQYRIHERWLLIAGGMVVAFALLLARDALRAPAFELTQDDFDAAVLHTLETKDLPSRAARAAALVAPSVVRVKGFEGEENDEPGAAETMQGVGTGVVIVDTGVILTNLHVVSGAKRITATFADGTESELEVVGAFPENDLAVVRAKTVPDDLQAATLGSTQNLQPGDEVVAVGFPFGIGPSVSAGVVSGLDREFRSADGKRAMTGLIQFDAAANPGNSGGPLITMNGEVVGIVTAILNPTPSRTFIGIGFAATIESAGSAVGIPPF